MRTDRLNSLRRVLGVLLLAVGLLTVLGGGCSWKASSGGSVGCFDNDGDGYCDNANHDHSGGGGLIIIVVEGLETADEGEPGPSGASAARSGGGPAAVPGSAGPGSVGPGSLLAGPGPGEAPGPPVGDDPAAWLLHDALIDPGGPGQHPVAAVREIVDISLGLLWGPGSYGPAELRDFTARVRAANPALLELPAGAGGLVFDGLQATGDVLAVRWRQDLGAGGPWLLAGSQSFVFDALGQLLRIDNALIVPG